MMANQWSPVEIYEHLHNVISSQRFLKNQGLGNEVPFFICPYSPTIAIEIEQRRMQLVNSLKLSGITVLDINLYDESVKLLKERNIWDRTLQRETKMEKSDLSDLLRNVLDPEKHLIPSIKNLIDQSDNYDVIFLSGVGEIYPYIRSHTVLNNLQSTAKQHPTVMFFPGTYTYSSESGSSLDLFSRLRDDKYYRAFNILLYNI